jgi:hypothetical protein
MENHADIGVHRRRPQQVLFETEEQNFAQLVLHRSYESRADPGHVPHDAPQEHPRSASQRDVSHGVPLLRDDPPRKKVISAQK